MRVLLKRLSGEEINLIGLVLVLGWNFPGWDVKRKGPKVCYKLKSKYEETIQKGKV